MLLHHKQNNAELITICDCITGNPRALPMPAKIIAELDKKIYAAANRVVVAGIDAYLSLLDPQIIHSFIVALRGRLDEQKLNAVYLICNNTVDNSLFSNPRYENAMQIVHISENLQNLDPPSILILSKKWRENDDSHLTWRDLINCMGNFQPTGGYTLFLEDFATKQASLSSNVSQLFEIEDIAKAFYDIPEGLPSSTLEALITCCKDKNQRPHDFLESAFGRDNFDLRLVLKCLLDKPDSELWLAFVHLLRKRINDNSYMAHVLSLDITRDNLLRKYVAEAPLTILEANNAEQYAKERASGIRELGDITESLIIEFISNLKSSPDDVVACWLNCGTKAERLEIIRRASSDNLTAGLPHIWHGSYHVLADYLSFDYDYGSADLTTYFKDYRRMKINNSVPVYFANTAYGFTLPNTIVMCDAVLQDLSIDNETALLIVDGMGAEYYPLILAMAKRKGLNVESATIVAARLPTSTKFNPITWNKDRCLEPINEIDNIAHKGAVMYEQCSPEENIEASLSVFAKIFNRIASGLTKYGRVVLTADHGSSRLAVLARDGKLDNVATLPWVGKPVDWRYSPAPQNIPRPDEFEPFYDETTRVLTMER